MAGDWDIALGEKHTRAEISERYGGARFGGIEPSGQSPNVFIYSDRAAGREHGYTFDGWAAGQDIFLYTGDGQNDQEPTEGGNAAILSHRDRGNALRVFVADGTVAGTSRAKLHRYIGEFAVDDRHPYFIDEAPNRVGHVRKVLVFRLLPVGGFQRRTEEASDTGDAASHAECEVVDAEAHEAPQFERAGTAPAQARRTESELVKRYERYLMDEGHTVKRLKLRAAGQGYPMWSDTYVADMNELTEAKGAARRQAVREAIGQLFDYRRLAKPRPQTLAVLLPSRPPSDLVALLHELKIALVWETPDGHFKREDP